MVTCPYLFFVSFSGLKWKAWSNIKNSIMNWIQVISMYDFFGNCCYIWTYINHKLRRPWQMAQFEVFTLALCGHFYDKVISLLTLHTDHLHTLRILNLKYLKFLGCIGQSDKVLVEFLWPKQTPLSMYQLDTFGTFKHPNISLMTNCIWWSQ